MEETKKLQRIEDTNYDRITNLPEAVLRHIISFLPTEDAMRTSVLSKRWRYLWTCIPILDFDEFFFSDQKALMEFYIAVGQQRMVQRYWFEGQRKVPYDLRRLHKQKKAFVDFVDRALLLHEGKVIQELRISFRYCGNFRFVSHSNQWFLFALTSVRVLDLNFAGEINILERDPCSENPYELPPCYFSAKLLKALTLHFCVFRPLDYNGFPSLEKLILTRVKLPDASVQDLLSHCPLLEALRLEKCCVSTDFVIYAPTSNLKCLCVDSCLCYMDEQVYTYGINIPSLLHFKFVGKMLESFSVKHLQNLVSADIEFQQDIVFDGHGEMICELIKDLGRAVELTLCSWCLQVLPTRDGAGGLQQSLPSPLSNLRHLTVNTGLDNCEVISIACLLRSSPNLETLSIVIGYSVDMNWEFLNDAMDLDIFYFEGEKFWESQPLPFHCLHRRLWKIDLFGFEGQGHAIELVKFLLKNSMVLEEMVITYVEFKSSSHYEYLEFLEEQMNNLQKLLAFPRASPCAEIIFS